MDFSWCVDDFDLISFAAFKSELEKKTALTVDEKLLLCLCLLELRASLDDFDALLASINSSDLSTFIQKGQYAYLCSAQKRSFNKLDEAMGIAQEAYLSLKQARHPLRWLLRVQLCTYYYELRKFHFAAESCQEIIDSIDTPNYVLVKAYENMATISLLIGHYSSVENNLHKHQTHTVYRLRLHQELIEGKSDFLCELLQRKWEDERLTSFLALEMALGLFYFSTPAMLELYEKSELKKFFLARASSALFSKALQLFGPSQKSHNSSSTSWVENLWCKYFEFLLLAKTSYKEEALHVMVTDITPFFSESHFFSPLMPHLVMGRFYPDNAISSLLANWVSTKKPISQKKFVEIHDSSLIFFQDGNRLEVRLDRSETSLNLLRVLAGPAGTKTTKEAVHRQLSLDPYDAFIHDSRIYKLLTRLRDKLKGDNIPELWSLPGDNTIEILCDFVIR